MASMAQHREISAVREEKPAPRWLSGRIPGPRRSVRRHKNRVSIQARCHRGPVETDSREAAHHPQGVSIEIGGPYPPTPTFTPTDPRLDRHASKARLSTRCLRDDSRTPERPLRFTPQRKCRDDSLLLAQPKQIDVTKIRQADLFDTANMRFPVLRTQRPEGQRCTGTIE